MSIFHYIYALRYWQALVIFVVGAVLWTTVKQLLGEKRWFKSACYTGFALFTIFILCFTIFARIGARGNADYGVSLVPFSSYAVAFSGNEEGFRTCFMNAMLYAPLGLLYFGVGAKKHREARLLVFAFCLSLFTEIMQYVFALGFAEIDDLIHNTIGAMLGYYACFTTEYAIKK